MGSEDALFGWLALVFLLGVGDAATAGAAAGPSAPVVTLLRTVLIVPSEIPALERSSMLE